ncbi:MAG: hypothetical protein ABI671_12755 [Burkholderiales bacterium]
MNQVTAALLDHRPLRFATATRYATTVLVALCSSFSMRGVVTLTCQVVSPDIALQFARASKRPAGVKRVDASGLTVATR